MEAIFEKPQAAREIEARARARRLGVEVRVVTEASAYTSKSQSRPNTRYAQRRTPAGWVCSCAGYGRTGCCKHLGQVERRAEREGWDFGAIAPLHRAGRYLPLDESSAAAPAMVVPFRRREITTEQGVTPALDRRSA